MSEEINGFTTERLLNNVDTIMQKVFDGHFLDFIKIAARFPTFDYKNQLLIWRQSPDSHFIAGIEAYKASRREIKPDSQPIMLLYPHFVLTNEAELSDADGITYEIDVKTGTKIPSAYPVFDLQYIPIRAYDISNTEGDEDKSIIDKRYDLDEALLDNGIMVVDVDESDLGSTGRYGDGIVIETSEDGSSSRVTFAVDKELRGVARQNKLIEMFVSYATDADEENNNGINPVFDNITEGLLRELIILTVQQYFGSDIDKQGAGLEVRYSGLKGLEGDVKRRLIKRLCADSSTAIRCLDKSFMTFDEIAFVNSFVRSEAIFIDQTSFVCEFLKLLLYSTSQSMDDIRDEADSFIEFISYSNTEFVRKLYKMVKDGTAYTYPPIYYEL